MKRRVFIQQLILLTSSLSVRPTIIFKGTKIKEQEFELGWTSYTKNPTDENACIVYELVPLYDSYDNEIKIRICNTIDLTVDTLENHLMTGSKSALDLSFKLHSITTGALSSYLNIIKGQFIHIDPKLFLDSLDKHIHLVSLRKVLGNYGIEFVDEFKVQNVETKKRIDSLKKVTDISLLKLRNHCIGTLAKKFNKNFLARDN